MTIIRDLTLGLSALSAATLIGVSCGVGLDTEKSSCADFDTSFFAVQLGTGSINSADSDRFTAVAVNSAGEIFAVGQTNGQVTDEPLDGVQDIFIAKFDPQGRSSGSGNGASRLRSELETSVAPNPRWTPPSDRKEISTSSEPRRAR